jgi:hypothetical protein
MGDGIFLLLRAGTKNAVALQMLHIDDGTKSQKLAVNIHCCQVMNGESESLMILYYFL